MRVHTGRRHTEGSPDGTSSQLAVPDGSLQTYAPSAIITVDEKTVLVTIIDYLAVP